MPDARRAFLCALDENDCHFSSALIHLISALYTANTTANLQQTSSPALSSASLDNSPLRSNLIKI